MNRQIIRFWVPPSDQPTEVTIMASLVTRGQEIPYSGFYPPCRFRWDGKERTFKPLDYRLFELVLNAPDKSIKIKSLRERLWKDAGKKSPTNPSRAIETAKGRINRILLDLGFPLVLAIKDGYVTAE